MYIVLVSYRRALEAKAAIYARLSGGDGVREEEDEGEGEEPRYMVDFTRKIWEEVNVCTCTCLYSLHVYSVGCYQHRYEWKGLWCSSTVWLLSTQTRVNARAYGLLKESISPW